jgi:hypothetical protein
MIMIMKKKMFFYLFIISIISITIFIENINTENIIPLLKLNKDLSKFNFQIKKSYYYI